jgi:hypothetical protein
LRIRLIFSIIALGLMMGCAARPHLSNDEKTFLEKKAKYEPNIGKTYWLRTNTYLCPRPAANILDCTSIPVGTKLQTDGIERGITSDPEYHVKLEDGRAGYIDALQLVTFATDVDPMQTAAECIRRGEPRIGMTAKQVEATCWGKPDHVDRLKTVQGVTDRYVYEKGRLVLHNGVVTSIKTSGTVR